MHSRMFDKYCPKCKASGPFYLSPADDKFAHLVCGTRFTNDELNDAFLRIHKATPKIQPNYIPIDRKAIEREDLMTSLDKNVALKFDTDKPRMELLDSYAMEQIALVMTFGAKKYADHNWRKGFKWSRLIGAALRHITAFARGEDKDPESGLSHLAHAGCCIMFLLWHEQAQPALDDRYKDANGL